MKLEQQVCSLDLAKRLKELEVNQESYFGWFYNDGMGEWELDQYQTDWPQDEPGHNDVHQYSAFTVAELGQMLPEAVDIGYFKVAGKWRIYSRA